MRDYADISKLGLTRVYKCIDILRREHGDVIERNGIRFELATVPSIQSMYGSSERRYRVSEKGTSDFRPLGFVIYYHDGGNFITEDFDLVRLWEVEHCIFLTNEGDVLERVDIKETHGGLESLSECQRDDAAGVYRYYTLDYLSYKEELWDLPISRGN